MLRSFIGDENSPGGQLLSTKAAQGPPAAGLGSQESSGIGVLSRPPLSFLQKYVRGRPRTAALCDDRLGSAKSSFLCDESVFLRQMDDVIPVPHAASNLTQLQGLFKGHANIWLVPDSGGPEAGVCPDQRTKRAQSRTFLSGVWSASSETNLTALRTWVPESRGGGTRWWSSLWAGGAGAEAAQSLVAGVCRGQGWKRTGPRPRTKAPAVFIQRRWMLGEGAGPSSNKGEGSSAGAAAHLRPGGGPAALEQDHGYASLEEELFQVWTEIMLTEAPPAGADEGPAAQPGRGQQEPPEEPPEDETRPGEAAPGQRLPLTLPKCQNKAIAFIMGCPCSEDEEEDGSQSEGGSSDDGDDDEEDDDEGSQSEGGSSDEDEDEEDDGFDSEGSSGLSECSSRDAELGASLGSSRDPQSFRAQPGTRPQSGAAQASCPRPLAAPPPPWDGLWASFSSGLDPYSPLNFQAALRTPPGPAAPGSRPGQASCGPASEEAEPAESGASRARGRSARTPKKVRFCDRVDEIFIGAEEEEEERRGPWEELARDRCRFLRRCQEVEQSIAYCLQPQHRRLVSLRLSGSSCSSAQP